MMAEIDVRGFSCPIPVVKTKQAMDANPEEVLTVLLETAVSKENVLRLAASRGYTVKEEAVSGEYRLTLTPPAK
jgi:tRNA 2-thiouridine synthesizing protein A